jgi:hypothetical protein
LTSLIADRLVGERAAAEHQRLDDLDAQVRHRRPDADDLLAQPEVRGIHELQHFRADRGVHLDDLREGGGIRLRIRGEPRELRICRRYRGDALELAHERRQRRVLHELVQRMRLLDDRAQRFAVARFVEELVRDGQRPHDRLAFRLARQHDARGRGKIPLDVPQQLRAIHAGHAHVGDDHVGRRLLHRVQCLLAAQREGHFPALALLAQ